MSRILVTTARMWYSLNAIRILAKQGHQVYAVDSTRNSGGLYSKYVEERFLSPPLTSQPREYIDFIVDIVKSKNIEAILPSYEEVFVLSYYKDLLPEQLKVLISPYPVLAMLHDKYHMTRYAERLGIPVPKTLLLKDFRPEEWQFPVILKPRRGRGAAGVKRVRGLPQMKAIMGTLNSEEYLVQQELPRVQYCTIGVAYEGKLKGNTIYKNLREFPESGGTGTSRLSVKVEKITDYIERIVKDLNYTGFFAADFLYDKSTDTYNIVDVNPRLNPGIYAGYVSGVDLPTMYVDLLLNPESVETVFSRNGTGSYTLFLEIGWFFSTLFKGKFRRLFSIFKKGPKLKEDVWDWRDIKPFFVVFWIMLLSVFAGPFYGGDQEFVVEGAKFDDKLLEKPEELIELEKENIAV